MNRPARFSPWVDMEEAEVIEEASRRTGKTPSQFVKEAGIASALAVLDVGREGQGGIQCVSKAHRKHCIDRFR
jgi:uncharacterized protein (DUF1778 family)